ncbi:transporter substrate-binding domain-containing protein [Seleniivibrio woodruffii]|uniref:transporter substrate-binding domain-containing protein n=1 Tax=Seleniivibrio woodruffii TaxID=1078050 RepID=UPI0026F17256|nr:transporter substrate-binding domain-containing protein [Seleniivibrio woodruffii]
MRITVLIFSALLFAWTAFAESTLERIEKSGRLKIGFRPDAYPFSYFNNKTKQHEGFSVDMANMLANNLSKRFGKKITITAIGVKADQRLEAVISGKVDIEMGSSTYSFERERNVDFSLFFFQSETTFMTLSDSGVTKLKHLTGKKIGCAKGTSTLSEIQHLVKSGHIHKGSIKIFPTISSGINALKDRTIDAYATDRSLLQGIKSSDRNPDSLHILNEAVAYDPYAYIVKENDSDFLDFVNSTIRWSVLSGQYRIMYEKWMGKTSASEIKMPPSLREYLNIVSIPMENDWYKK